MDESEKEMLLDLARDVFEIRGRLSALEKRADFMGEHRHYCDGYNSTDNKTSTPLKIRTHTSKPDKPEGYWWCPTCGKVTMVNGPILGPYSCLSCHSICEWRTEPEAEQSRWACYEHGEITWAWKSHICPYEGCGKLLYKVLEPPKRDENDRLIPEAEQKAENIDRGSFTDQHEHYHCGNCENTWWTFDDTCPRCGNKMTREPEAEQKPESLDDIIGVPPWRQKAEGTVTISQKKYLEFVEDRAIAERARAERTRILAEHPDDCHYQKASMCDFLDYIVKGDE